MLVTDVGDEMRGLQIYDDGDGFSHFGNQHPLAFYIGVGQQHSKYVNIFKSPTSRCHPGKIRIYIT